MVLLPILFMVMAKIDYSSTSEPNELIMRYIDVYWLIGSSLTIIGWDISISTKLDPTSEFARISGRYFKKQIYSKGFRVICPLKDQTSFFLESFMSMDSYIIYQPQMLKIDKGYQKFRSLFRSTNR